MIGGSLQVRAQLSMPRAWPNQPRTVRIWNFSVILGQLEWLQAAKCRPSSLLCRACLPPEHQSRQLRFCVTRRSFSSPPRGFGRCPSVTPDAQMLPYSYDHVVNHLATQPMQDPVSRRRNSVMSMSIEISSNLLLLPSALVYS